MDQICHRFLHAVSLNLGILLKQVCVGYLFLQKPFALCRRKMCKRFFSEINKSKTVFNFLRIVCPTKAMPSNFDN